MCSTKWDEVAIIGGGLAVSPLLDIKKTSTNTLQGMSLALTLHKDSIHSTIYELRLPTVEAPGALMLSPNSLRILDALGVYERIRTKGYNFESLYYNDANNITLDTYLLGSETQYGYKALRIYRKVLLAELRSMLTEAGIPIHYEKRFSHVVSEDEDGVTFAFADGDTHTVSLLIGADGIHSTVRKYLTPVVPAFAGQLAVTGHIPKPDIAFPEGGDYPLPASIFAKPGAFVMAPQDVDGQEIFFGRQFPYPEQDHKGWSALMADKPELLRLLQQDLEDWPPLVQSVLRKIDRETLSLWAYYVVPEMESWTSSKGKVVILGDAAHAIPPTAGQGASQAFEDTYTFALLVARSCRVEGSGLEPSKVEAWQKIRQERVESVIALTKKLNNTRLPAAEKAKLREDELWTSKTDGDLGWLYNARMEEQIASLI